MRNDANLEELVLKLNEYYHDLVGDEYENLHPEIFKDEARRWRMAGEKYLAGRPEELRILDLGSGSGFVPSRLIGLLKKNDQFICSDISWKILVKCRDNLHRRRHSCLIEYIKTDGRSIPLSSSSIDMITMNSFLHHVHDLQGLYREINRLVKPGGMLLVGHEPNLPFFSHVFLWHNFTFLSQLQNNLNKLSFWRDPGPDKWRERSLHARIFSRINQRLLADRVISRPLSGRKISEIIDIHSCTAGGLHRNRPDLVMSIKRGLPEFSILECKTYHHLYKLSYFSRGAKWYDALLRRIFPENGALFFLAAKKGGNKNE